MDQGERIRSRRSQSRNRHRSAGDRIYASITNHHHIPYRLTTNGVIGNTIVTGGSWAALDPMTGVTLWQTADPQIETVPGLGVVRVSDSLR